LSLPGVRLTTLATLATMPAVNATHRRDRYVQVIDRGYLMRDTSGRAVRMIGAMQEITEQRRAEREIQSLTAQLARLMGGEAGAQSAPGRGSLFWFTVRLDRGLGVTPSPSDAPPNADDAEAALRRCHAGARVLLVEDEPINREVALELLRETALTVEIAEDGREAVEKARTADFALRL
jgi:hypothetical protein